MSVTAHSALIQVDRGQQGLHRTYIGALDKQEQTLTLTSPAASVDIFPELALFLVSIKTGIFFFHCISNTQYGLVVYVHYQCWEH